MSDFVLNISLGRVAELYNRVDLSDPTNAVLVIIVWNSTATDATIRDLDSVELIEQNANTVEVSNTNYARKVLSDSDIVAFAPDDANDRVDLDIPDQTWTAVAAGSAWTDISINYDDSSITGTGTAGDDTMVPLTWHDFSVTPDGSDISMAVAAAGFYRASPV